ncbi:swarming motility regulation two-component system, sensor kinase [Proteus mirabilis]|uniref:Swarming motility regulation two-component system, sensor kinase n=1 Tax=Proteus mirabilis TaxID=584 RepID=A0A379GGA7_PROMI|nr:swarming motility regulation two-component system, sensor kinase [Proteus mirabilis]
MARIDAANIREKQFMADAAHELRTPDCSSDCPIAHSLFSR